MRFSLKGNFFAGNYHLPPTSGLNSVERIIKKVSPANLSDKLWECPVDNDHVDAVVDSSIKGFSIWRRMSIEERKNFLLKYKDRLMAKKDEIARAISYEAGKPLWEAMTEAAALVGKIDVTISDSLPRVQSKTIENILPKTQGTTYYKPIGPCFIIGPFNFPCHLANGQITSALIAGNSIIFKPSEKTCYSAQLMFDCMVEAGFPEGVVNLIQGDGEIARRVLQRKEVKGVFFTGSKDVGQKILEVTHKDLSKMVALELGGKNTSIIHQDANIDHALSELVKACFLTAGQRCTSTGIIALHESHVEQFVSKFHSLAKRIIIDHPIDFDKEPFMGPLIDQGSVDTYLNFMGMAKREGIEEVMRGKLIEKKFKGHYVSPSIHLAKKWSDQSHFLMNELFGPNATIVPYRDIEEAIAIANSTEYGLAASVFTQSDSVFEKCLYEIDSGLLNLNRSTVGASARLPFGGVKNSGNYRPAAVATIDSCVYQMASLKIFDYEVDDINKQIGMASV